MNTQTEKLKYAAITFSLAVLATVLMYVNFPNLHKDKSPELSQSTPKLDIYAFTKKYNIEKNKQIILPKNQQETVDTIMKSFDIFSKESHYKQFPLLNDFAKKNDLELESEITSERFYNALRWKDGSDVKVLYEHYNITRDTHEIHIYNLTQQQCKYLLDKYQTNTKIRADVNNYSLMPGGLSVTGANCDDLTTKYTSVAVQLRTIGESFSITYDKKELYQKISQLLTKKYEKYLEKNKDDKLYFTQKIEFDDFLKGVDFSIDKEGAVYIGGLNKIECKRIMYNVPNNLKAVPNKDGVCSNNSIIKFTPNL